MDKLRLLIINGQIVTNEGFRQADILLENGKISRITRGLRVDAKVIDAGGMLIFPGFIDTHTHFDMPLGDIKTADDFDSGTRAALLGGTTTVLDFATQEGSMTLHNALDVWSRKAEGAHCNYGFHMAISRVDDGVLHEILMMPDCGITSFKFYMAYPNLLLNDDEIYRALCKIKEIGGIAGVHCEDAVMTDELTERLLSKGKKEVRYHAEARPDDAEAKAIEKLVKIARKAGAAVNVVHVSSRKGLESIKQARANGAMIYAETCPQYLIMTDELYDRPDGDKFVISPPLRKAEDCSALWMGIAQGDIDTLGTDHCSFTLEQKSRSNIDFSRTPGGMPGVQHRAQLFYTYGVQAGRAIYADMLRLMCENPARLFGMYPRKGVIAEGSDADITIWNPDYSETITKENSAYNCDYSPFEGMQVSGRAEYVILGGKIAVRNGEQVLESGGVYVPRRRSNYFRD